MELIIKNHTQVQVVNVPNKNKYAVALENNKLRDFPQELKNTNTLSLIDWLLNLLGVNEKEGSIDHHAVAFNFVNENLNNYTYQEIKLAFNMFVSGQLTDEQGKPLLIAQQLNAVVIGKVMKAYQDLKVQNLDSYYRAKKKLLSPPPTEPTPEERKEIRRQFLKNVFDDIKNTGYYDYAWLIYDDLSAQNKILVGDSRKKEMYAQQLEKYTQELKSGGFKRGVLRKIEKIKSSDRNTIIVNRCKNILVAEYLEEFEGDFEEFYKDLDN